MIVLLGTVMFAKKQALIVICSIIILGMTNSLSKIYAQQAILNNNNDELKLINKVELLQGSFATQFNLADQQIGAACVAEYLDSAVLSEDKVLNYNIKQLQQNYSEWFTQSDASNTKRWFYKGADMYQTPEKENYFVAINPIINYQHGIERNDTSGTKFLNIRGFDIRAHIKKRIYLYTQLTENQERGPSYVQQFIGNVNQVPGAAYIKAFNKPGYRGGYDYSLARGHIAYNVLPKHLDIAFGHDRFFIGDGYRSLFLSDFSTNALFAKLDLRFWKLHYRTIFFELMPYLDFTRDVLRPRKYAAMHHATFHFKPWLNVGVFEGVIHGRKNHFEFQYLNPIIFYRTIEQAIGSPDNAVVGLDFRVIPLKRTEVYGQLLIDEFVLGALRARNGDWRNKQAIQLGVKHVDLAGVKNLDVQVEYNRIRPFTYSYYDSVADYTHYNQSLAHPNGANLSELIAIARYQPLEKLCVSAELIMRAQGMDTSNTFSNGGNIFKSYNLRNGQEIGFPMLNGRLQRTMYLNTNVSYQVYNNAYIDGGFTLNNTTSNSVNRNSTFAYVGARLNCGRRKYNY
jgi:hypothetical protein